jgi:cytolysin (calcineurin-like family phosphatase)
MPVIDQSPTAADTANMKADIDAINTALQAGGITQAQLASVVAALDDLKTSIDPKVLTHVAIDFSSSAAQTIIAAPGAGNRIRIVELDLTALTNVEVAVKSASTTIRTFQFATLAWAPPMPLNLGTNEALALDSVTADRITGGVSYYVEDVT